MESPYNEMLGKYLSAGTSAFFEAVRKSKRLKEDVTISITDEYGDIGEFTFREGLLISGKETIKKE